MWRLLKYSPHRTPLVDARQQVLAIAANRLPSQNKNQSKSRDRHSEGTDKSPIKNSLLGTKQPRSVRNLNNNFAIPSTRRQCNAAEVFISEADAAHKGGSGGAAESGRLTELQVILNR